MKRITKIYVFIGEWGFILFYLNILWIVFTILGVGIFGLFPSTVSLFAVLRKMLIDGRDQPIFQLFWKNYKQEFVKSNIVGFIMTVIVVFLLFDLHLILQFHPTTMNRSMTILLLVIIVFCIICFLNVFPIYVHFNFNISKYFFNSFILTMGKPVQTVMMLLGIYIIYLIYELIPGLIPVFGITTFCLLIMKIALLSFKKV